MLQAPVSAPEVNKRPSPRERENGVHYASRHVNPYSISGLLWGSYPLMVIAVSDIFLLSEFSLYAASPLDDRVHRRPDLY